MLEAAAGHAVVFGATLLAVGACVLLQYEYLVLVWRRLSSHGGHRRTKVLYGIGAVLLLHVIEIWIFGTVLWTLLRWEATGALAGEEALGFLDHIYFSAICFTTVGFGEIWPTGAVRFLAATEALAGFVLITWSASFTYLEMERFWRPKILEKGRE
jgi:Ion channel